MKRKQLWERFDWFWLNTQKYYSNEFTIDDICYEFQKLINMETNYIFLY